jgi:hypothetical protein
MEELALLIIKSIPPVISATRKLFNIIRCSDISLLAMAHSPLEWMLRVCCWTDIQQLTPYRSGRGINVNWINQYGAKMS